MWDILAAREPVRRYNVQWTLDLMREALRDPSANIPQDLIPSGKNDPTRVPISGILTA